MTESTDPKPELEIRSDADWKQRVKAEAAQLDQSRDDDQSADATAETPSVSDDVDREPEPVDAGAQEIDASGLPPTDFTTLVTMFSTQAMVALGVLPSPIDGKADRNLPLAKHFIDLLGVLQEKTRRNLTGHESNLIEQSLHELRMAYVELSQAEEAPPAS